MKRLIALVALLVATTSLNAGEMKPGTFGLGWYSPTAPVGGRVWVDKMVGIDVGLAFLTKELNPSMDDARFHVNVGVPIVVVQTEKVNFFIRPGVELQTNSRMGGATLSDKKSTIYITADLGAEWFVTEDFSLSVGHGLSARQVTDLSNGDDKFAIAADRALSFTNVGFHFYFK